MPIGAAYKEMKRHKFSYKLGKIPFDFDPSFGGAIEDDEKTILKRSLKSKNVNVEDEGVSGEG